MSEYNNILSMIGDGESNQEQDIVEEETPIIDPNKEYKPFDIDLFSKELHEVSENKNKAYAQLTQSINGYSIAHDCLACTVKKIMHEPVKSFAHKWLPILLRAEIGTAIHDFIQNNTTQFTETEPSIKVPSIRFSGRIDGLINNNILVEIKSCTYTDYRKIIKTRQPRKPDFYQTIVYKYILENYLNELKTPGVPTRTDPPKLNDYNIDKIQFIYVAHDIMSDDVDDFGEALARVKKLKQKLNSKRNQYFFMTSLVLDLNDFDCSTYTNYVVDKINTINYYVDNNKMPPRDHKYIDTNKCFFCLYRDNCEYRK